MARPTTRSNTSSPSRDKLHGEPTRPAAPAPAPIPVPIPVPVPDPIAPPSRPSTRPFHPPTPRPTTQSISPLPSRLVILASFWAVIVLALPFWWRTTTIERRPLPLAQIEPWLNKGPCYLTPKVSFAFESPAANKDRKVEQAIYATMDRLAKTELAQCLDLQWAQSLPDRLFGNASALLGGKPTDGSLIAPSPSMAKFSPTYKLVFSLLNEDSSSGDALLEWQIHSLLKRHVEPLLSALEPLHNFTIETSIQYFAPLTIPVQTIEGEGSWIVEDDLRAFVNNADWKLRQFASGLKVKGEDEDTDVDGGLLRTATSLKLDPILHFILFVPKKQHRPLRIRTIGTRLDNPVQVPHHAKPLTPTPHSTRILDGRSSPTGFITPQRGGVVIYNPPNIDPSNPSENPVKPPNLSTAFRLFEAQLRKLLGVTPTLPGPDFVTSWQIDALVRQRLNAVVKEAVENLSSLRKLVEEVQNMRVGKGVQKGVKRALEELKLAETHLPFSPALSLHHAYEALSLASKAYFDPSMLALLYFPDNHKYAIYTPLFGPVAVPLLMALAKEWKNRRGRGRGRGEEGEMVEKEKEKKEGEKEKEKEDEKGKEESSS